MRLKITSPFTFSEATTSLAMATISTMVLGASFRSWSFCFLLLAAYVAYESTADLWLQRAPEHSIAGILLACVSLVVMPLLSRAKRKVGRFLRSSAMHADAKQTEFCAYLSAILLLGLLLNTFFTLWWADPVAAVVMVPIIAKEASKVSKARRVKIAGVPEHLAGIGNAMQQYPSC